jgi:hypothetical protein
MSGIVQRKKSSLSSSSSHVTTVQVPGETDSPRKSSGSTSSSPQSSKEKRLTGVIVERPIIYGSIAYWMGKKADPEKTHQWTCYVRGPNNENLSHFIKKVVFNLHSSFEKPKRGMDHVHHIYSSYISYSSKLMNSYWTLISFCFLFCFVSL